MTRSLAILTAVLLVSGCGTSTGATGSTSVTQTVTVNETVTATQTVTADGDVAATNSTASTASLGPPAPDACSLLTQAEAEKVAGTKLMKAVGAGANKTGGFVMCQLTGPTIGPTAQVEVYVGDGAKQQLHIERDNLKHVFTTVPGVGDQCVQEDDFIFVEKNGIWASIHLVRLNDPKANISPLRTGIAQVAARLP